MSTPLSAATFAPLDDLDPATPGDPFTRLRYHYGQLLVAEDFTTEQRYFLLRSRLHNALLHGVGTAWGIVLLVVAVVMVVTAAVGFCPLYRLFGISTCKVPNSASAAPKESAGVTR